MSHLGYIERAAAAVLLWSELLDDSTPAEECATAHDLTGRRDAFRRELREFAEARRPGAAVDKWVQRAFWSAPPKRGQLDDAWKETLCDWVRAMELGDAGGDLELAMRALFADGVRALEELAARRPCVFERVRELIGGAPVAPEILKAPATLVSEDSVLPMYMTDRDLQRVVWCNRSFETFFGLARDQIVGHEMVALQGRFAQMMVPEEAASYLQRQEEVKVAGKNIGRAYIELVVDMALRPWTAGQPTPPWEGRYRVHVNANFVFDRATNVRIGSYCVFFPVRFPG